MTVTGPTALVSLVSLVPGNQNRKLFKLARSHQVCLCLKKNHGKVDVELVVAVVTTSAGLGDQHLQLLPRDGRGPAGQQRRPQQGRGVGLRAADGDGDQPGQRGGGRGDARHVQDFLLQADDGTDWSGCWISGRLLSLPSHSWSFQGSYSDHIIRH